MTGPIPFYPRVSDLVVRCAGDPRYPEHERPRCHMETFGRERCYFHTKVAAGLIGRQPIDGRATGARWQ